jgi:hypothetical protein
LTKIPFSLGFLACAPGNGFFVFGLVEITFAALGAVGSRIDAEMLAEVLVTFRLFEFVVLGFGFWLVFEWNVLAWTIVSVQVPRPGPVESTPGSGALNAWTKCLPAQVAHRVPADAGQLVTA